MVTRRIKPMMIDGKKTYQIGIPIHWGYRGIAEDAGRTALTQREPAVADGHRSECLHAGVQGFPREAGEGLDDADRHASDQSDLRPRGHRSRRTASQREEEVCKYIDVTTCIGCKACEVACVEWNDMPFQQTTFDNTYQTMPATAWNYWNLIKFNEHQREDGTLQWLMRKDQCMHCEDPGCLRACPADGAIVQYTNGIVDFQQENCIGCQYCVSGCPFDIPKFNSTTKKVYKCTLCSDRVGQGLEPACIKSCPTGCLKFGTKTDMRGARRRARASSCASIQDSRTPASTIRRRSAARTSSTCCTTSRSRSCYGGLPANPQIPPTYTIWKRVAKPIALLLGLFAAPVAFFHYVTEGPKEPQPPVARGAAMSTAVERFDEGARRAVRRARTDGRASRRAAAASGLHARAALGRRGVLHPRAAVRVRDLLAVAVSLADAAVRRRADDAAAASVVQPRVRRRSSRCSSLNWLRPMSWTQRRQPLDAAL